MADLNALLVFAGVAQAEGFSAAGRRLGMPVSTVSRQIAGLEDQLGVRLIDRSTRSFRLTELGIRILEQAQRGPEISETVDRLAAEQASTAVGLLRLSAPSAVAGTLLAPVVAAFGMTHPEVRIQVSVGNFPIGDPVDLAFRLGTLEDSALIALRVLRYRDLLVASPGYLAQCKAPGKPGDLAQHRLLTLLDRMPSQRWTFVRSGNTERETMNVRPHMATDDTASLIAAALAGGGICTLPPAIRPELLQNGGLVEVMPDWRLEAVDLYMLHLGRRHVPRPVQIFKEMAARMIPERFSDLPS